MWMYKATSHLLSAYFFVLMFIEYRLVIVIIRRLDIITLHLFIASCLLYVVNLMM